MLQTVQSYGRSKQTWKVALMTVSSWATGQHRTTLLSRQQCWTQQLSRCHFSRKNSVQRRTNMCVFYWSQPALLLLLLRQALPTRMSMKNQRMLTRRQWNVHEQHHWNSYRSQLLRRSRTLTVIFSRQWTTSMHCNDGQAMLPTTRPFPLWLVATYPCRRPQRSQRDSSLLQDDSSARSDLVLTATAWIRYCFFIRICRASWSQREMTVWTL